MEKWINTHLTDFIIAWICIEEVVPSNSPQKINRKWHWFGRYNKLKFDYFNAFLKY